MRRITNTFFPEGSYNAQDTRQEARLPTLGALFFAAIGLLAAAPALAQSNSTLVGVDPVSTQEVAETASVIGRFVARDAGPVAAAVEGPVEAFLVEVGDRVTKGGIIAVIDGAELDARRSLAVAQLAQADAAVVTAQAELTLAQQELARAEGLKGSSAYSPARTEDSRARVAIAEATVAEANALKGARSAELRLAELELARARVAAPYDGVVMETRTEVGAYVDAGDPLIELMNDSALELEADVPFSLLAGLTVGEEISVRLDDGLSLIARVRAVVPAEDPLTRTRVVRFLPIEALVSGGQAVGQTAVLALPTGPSRQALTVDKDAVIPSPQGALVYVAVERDGKLVAEARRVVLGTAVGGRFEVVDGLQEGDLAVIRGNERLQPGQVLELTG